MVSVDLKDVRLLLVDDEADFRSTLTKRLGRRGVTALQAGSGEEALEVLAEHQRDVVVLDVKMSGMGGLEALKRIRRQHPQTEVILLTGHAATQDGVEGIKSGAFDYLTKPVEFDHLLGKIVQACDKIRSEKREQEAAAYKERIKQQMIATERLAALGTLAAGVAHEINNPLAIINEAAGYLSQLLARPEQRTMPHAEAFARALDKIESSVKRARAITHQLLGSVRKSETVLKEIDPRQLVEETLQLLRQEAKERQVEVAQAPAAEAPLLWTDPNQLRQVLINLLSNAIQATAPKGQVTVALEPAADGVIFTISDTGCGIAPEHLDKIFEPFFSTKPQGQGTGLGLFVTREIVEKMGGRVSVESRLGHGARFAVQIPNSRSMT